jgi:diacylglycerol kinase (ATP)
MDQKNKWVFIVNPIAGNGYSLSLIDKIQEMINKYNIEGEIVFTERRGHASELSKKYAENGYRYIIAVGGDGTFNEVATPLVFNENVITGAVSGGTGNDTNQITGFPNRFKDKEWENFFKGDFTRMDVGKCNDKTFLNGIGIGFDAQVAAQNYTESGEVILGGKNKYLWHILKILLFFKEKKMIVITNGKRTETDCFINTVANGRRFARSFFLTPKAIANDGVLDVCSIKRLSLIQRIKLLLMVPKGTHINDKRVNYYQTENLILEFPVKVPFHADGELFYAKRFEISLIRDALNVLYNPEGNHCFSFKQ